MFLSTCFCVQTPLPAETDKGRTERQGVHIPPTLPLRDTACRHKNSLVPRPPLAAFFAAVKKRVGFHGCEKGCQGRPGYEVNTKDGGVVSAYNAYVHAVCWVNNKKMSKDIGMRVCKGTVVSFVPTLFGCFLGIPSLYVFSFIFFVFL